VDNFDFVLVANSPGELSSLVKPIVERIKARSKESRITLFLTPCQYSSGREAGYAKTLGVNEIICPEDYRKWILGIPIKREMNFKNRGAVLFLGGDLMHAVLIAKKLGFKAYAYLHGQKAGWKNVFSKFFVIDQKAAAGIRHKNVRAVGDLMMNSITALSKTETIKNWKLDSNKPIVAMLPGSRLWESDLLVPFYEIVAAELKKIIPGMQIILVLSPFTSMKDIEKKLSGNMFDLIAPLNSIPAADLAITIPGTNTAQIAALGIPFLMIFPLNKLDSIPLEGLLHYVTKIPLAGKIIKQLAAKIICSKTRFFALPNMKARKMVAPELVGKLSAEQVVEKTLELLGNPEALKHMGNELKKLMGESNAADIIVEEIINEAFLPAC